MSVLRAVIRLCLGLSLVLGLGLLLAWSWDQSDTVQTDRAAADRAR